MPKRAAMAKISRTAELPRHLRSGARPACETSLMRKPPIAAQKAVKRQQLAREARCVYFIDRALSTFARGSQPAYIQGLRELQAKTRQLYPGADKFSALTPAQQIKTLTEIEKTPFFTMVRTHTVIGFLTRPVHGGNQGKIGRRR